MQLTRIHITLKQGGIKGATKDTYVGDEAWVPANPILGPPLKRPIENGVVTNRQDLYHVIFQALYHELRIEPENFNVVITQGMVGVSEKDIAANKLLIAKVCKLIPLRKKINTSLLTFLLKK